MGNKSGFTCIGGQAPKPTALKILEGNPGNQKLPKNEPEPVYIMPDPPEHLCKTAREEWDRVCLGLFHMKLLSEVDRSALASYCSSYALWANAWNAINKLAESGAENDGLVIKTSHGNYIQNPNIGIANVACRDMMRIACEFGMTPAARTRIGVKLSKDNNKSKFGTSLLNGKANIN